MWVVGPRPNLTFRIWAGWLQCMYQWSLTMQQYMADNVRLPIDTADRRIMRNPLKSRFFSWNTTLNITKMCTHYHPIHEYNYNFLLNSICFLLGFLVWKLTQQDLLEILGVIFDKNFNFQSHISAICSTCFHHIRDLWRIHRYLDLNNAKLLAMRWCLAVSITVVHFLSGIADTDLTKLQRVQNRLAHVVTKSPPFTHSVSLLRSLHWLPVKFRVDFKICLLTYKTQWKTTCLSTLLACYSTSITFTEIK